MLSKPLLFALALSACGRSPLDLGEVDAGPPATPADFVGTWTCDATASTTATSDTWPETLLVTFAARPDGSLTMTYQVTKKNGAPVNEGVSPLSPYRFEIWGHTANATSGQTTTTPKGATLAFASGEFRLNGTEGSLTLTSTVSGPASTGVVDATDTISGSCTKNP
jgi:hypothetical protein